MRYQLKGTQNQTLEIFLEKKEEVFTVPEAFMEKEECINKSSSIYGGLIQGIKRKIAGEHLFLIRLSCESSSGSLKLISPEGGQIVPVILNDQCLICQKDAFICSYGSISVNMVFAQKKIKFFPDFEGEFLQKISGDGQVFIKENSNLAEFDLENTEAIKLLNKGLVKPDPGSKMSA